MGTTIFGIEAPSNSNSTTESFTAATGRWTFTAGKRSRCQRGTSGNSGTRLGTPTPTIGISTRGKKSNNRLTTKSSRVRGQWRQNRREPKKQKKAIEVSRDSNFPKSRSMGEEKLYLYICTFKRAYTLFFSHKNVHFRNSGSMFLRKRR